jgi:methyltransferase (TIGR00027 family)
MEAGQPSRTAFVMAVLRARHHLQAAEPKVLGDSLAAPFAGLSSPDEVGAWADRFADHMAAYVDRDQAIQSMGQTELLTCARSRFMEDQLAAARARGVKQLVILGAGFDSTAYRGGGLTEGLSVFEVDHPATQDWKRQRLAEAGIAPPPNLRFTPFDFEHQTLAEALAAGGVRADQAAFFSWLGVQVYLTDQAVMATLQAIGRFPAGSELVMDLATPERPLEQAALMEASRRTVASLGEPYVSAYGRDDFMRRLQARGFGEVVMLGYPDWFARQGDRVGGRTMTPRASLLVSAKVG